MKWALIILYTSAMGLPVTKVMTYFSNEKDCRFASIDFMKQNKGITAICDYRDPTKETDK